MANHVNSSTRNNVKVIAFAAQKGGSGKTTLALHVAVEYARAGQRVALLDTDPQGSAAMWGGLRDTDDITVVPVAAGELAAVMADAASDGYDVVILDTPPHANISLAMTLRHATLAVLPFKPSPLDLATLDNLLEKVKAGHVPAVAVISAAPMRAAEITPMRQALEAGGLPVLDTVIHDLMPFRRSIGIGQSVAEFDPKGRAAMEIRALRREIDEVINSMRKEVATT